MRRIFWMLICAAVVLASGCIDLEQRDQRECLASRRCGPSEANVCGVDGTEYECASVAQCYGVAIDSSGQACDNPQQCEPVTCEMACPNGFATDENGCEICECADGPSCPPAPGCDPDCPDPVFVTDANGCESCQCGEEPTCPPMCDMWCPNGYKTDENGCEICECKEAASCQDDPCVPYFCASRQGECIRQSELARRGDCQDPGLVPMYFQEPDPQCLCGDQSCSRRDCARDSDCSGDAGLCAHTTQGSADGYCVTATCDEVAARYGEVAEQLNTCQSDDDCRMVTTLSQCCWGYAVNALGASELRAIDQFAARTSCGDDWQQMCAAVDCAPPPPGGAACINGTCQMPR